MTHANGKIEPTMGGREWIMLLALAALWGGSFFFFKIMVGALPPLTVVLARVGIAALLLNAWLAIRRDFMPTSASTWAAFVTMGLLNNVVPFALIVFSETRIPSGLASILNATTPMFGVLVAHGLTANEKITVPKAVGIGIGFVGVAVLIGPDALAGLAGADVLGEAACLLAAISYAFAGVYGRRFRGLDPVKVATGQITASTLVLVPLVAVFDRPWTLSAPGAEVWGAMFGIAVLCTVVAYVLYFRILAVAGATNLLLVTFLLPASALLLGWFVLGESIPSRAWGGMALIGAGLASIDGRLPRLLHARVAASPQPGDGFAGLRAKVAGRCNLMGGARRRIRFAPSPKRIESGASPPYSQTAFRCDNLPEATSCGVPMIVQACLNGARGRGYHDRLPLTRDDISRDAADCVAAGAAELHVHPRSDDGCESLTAVDETIRALRRCCPGTLVGVSTGAWIEGDPERTRQCIANWRETPDYASVNLSEPDAPAVMELLHRMSVGVEAGLATVADAERFVALAGAPRAFRILIEIDEQDLARAESICVEIASVLDRHEIRRPVLLHGFDATVWRFVRLARKARWSTRVGLEDGKLLPDGSIARGNAALVTAAVAMFAVGHET